MKTRSDNAATADAAQAARRNDTLTDAELEVVTAGGGGAGINPSRTDRGLGRSA